MTNQERILTVHEMQSHLGGGVSVTAHDGFSWSLTFSATTNDAPRIGDKVIVTITPEWQRVGEGIV